MTATNLLSKHGLNKTISRMEILEILINSKIALSEKEIQLKLGNICDRATIYRTLKTFTDNGILHPITTEELVTKYVVRKKPDEHMHFSCTECRKTFCLTDINFSNYNLPHGFTKKESNFLIIGICNVCNN